MNNIKNTEGITLISLVITIIILLILSAIVICSLTAENGIFVRSKEAKENTIKAQSRDELERVLLEAAIEKAQNEKYDKNDFLNEFIIEKISSSEIIDDSVKMGKYEFIIDRENLIIIDEKFSENVKKNESILGKILEFKASGNYNVEIEDEKYNFNVIVVNKNLVLDGENLVEGAILTNNVYEFGDKNNDVATATSEAKNMVVLKVNGNLTINENITVTSCKSDTGYGGPKGMLIYSSGTLTNNGTISMTARGAKAQGQNVYLWKNEDSSYEYIPAVGAAGGIGAKLSGYGDGAHVNGNNGSSAIEKRQTGGGGSGSVISYTYSSVISPKSGNGSHGTSYSGGTGGGTVVFTMDKGDSLNANANLDAENYGGKGGIAVTNRKDIEYTICYGGVGNPGGIRCTWRNRKLRDTCRKQWNRWTISNVC